MTTEGLSGSPRTTEPGRPLTIQHLRDSLTQKGPCLSHRIQPLHFAAAEAVLESTVTVPLSGRVGGQNAPNTRSCWCAQVLRSPGAGAPPHPCQPGRGSLVAVHPAGHSGHFFCKRLQASVSCSALGPELHQAGSLNEMAPKFLKWFNKTYTDCNVQFIVANYCPSVGKNDLQSAIFLSAS